MGNTDRRPSTWTRRAAAATVLLAAVAGCSRGSGDPEPARGAGLTAVEDTAAPTGTAPTGTAPGGTGPGGTGSGGTAGGAPGAAEDAVPAGDVVPPATRPAAAVAVPAGVMLRPGAWPGGVVRESETRLAGLAQTEPSACQAATAYPSDRHRLAARTVLIASDEPESGDVHQTVVRYAPGRADQAVAEMRRVLAACRSYRSELDPTTRVTVRYELQGQRFAGDDALLVRRADRQEGTTRDWADYVTVVRLGDSLVTTVSTLGEGVADPGLARRLAVTGARQAACLRSSC